MTAALGSNFEYRGRCFCVLQALTGLTLLGFLSLREQIYTLELPRVIFTLFPLT